MGTKHVLRLCGAAALLVVAVGCSSPDGGPEQITYVPGGGVDASNATLVANDVWVDAPEGIRAGGDADLRLYVVNQSDEADALTSVTSPAVQGDELLLDGRTVERLVVPAGGTLNLERGQENAVRLTGFRRPVTRSSWINVTLHFERSANIAMQVTVGPLS